MTWNTLDVPLENGWQCTLIPEPQYYDLTSWGRGHRNMSARQLYPNAGRDSFSCSWNAGPLSEVGKSEWWEKDRLRQLADDRAAFGRRFRPEWDLRSITGERALRDVQTFVRDSLNVTHWNLPTDNAGVRKQLCDAVASGQLVPVVNREYRGVPRVAPPAHAPQHWPATGGGGYLPKVYSYLEFEALKRANGELPPLDAPGGVVGATLNPLPDLGVPAMAGDGFGLLGFVESAAGVMPGGGGDSDNGAPDLAESMVDSSGDASGTSTLLCDAQAFDYRPDISDGAVEQIAGMPFNGEPGTWISSMPGTMPQMRQYGANGTPLTNFDLEAHHGNLNPHAHNWDGYSRGEGAPVSLLPWGME
ncbi:hypothetical protein [Paraburkholderia sacchari]|uniref:hypothetical protein n=1 Tax=Paraburkholderia sacchari TaxID=159450 RepID=UPI001BCFAE15|nr:hypothetical protein [Paraburkholderia sacchari]